MNQPFVDVLYELHATQAEREDYRVAMQQAIHRLHALQVELDRVREQHHRLIEEYRAFRAVTICQPPKVAA